MNFGKVLTVLWNGQRVAREGWNGKEVWIELQVPDEYSKMRRPYIFINPGDGGLVPWVALQSDLLASDWYILPPEDPA